MPVIVAGLIRTIIIWTIQIGLWSAISHWVLPRLNEGIVWIMTEFGVSEDTAKDIMANWFIQLIEDMGINIAIWKSKIPIQVAEKLGFTSKGFAKRPLSATVEAAIKKTAATAGIRGEITNVAAKAIAESVATSRGINVKSFWVVYALIMGLVGMTTGVGYTLAQYLDYGNWPSGTFHDFFAKIFMALGLPENVRLAKSGVLSSDTWTRYFNTAKQLNVVGINDPYKNQTILFTRQNLIDLVDKVASNILADGGQATLKNVLGVTQAFFIIKTATGDTTTGDKTTTTTTRAPIVPIKVFTGIVSQGTLGAAVDFTPRENDLIESVDELKDSAQNNLAPFIQALPGKIVYEIKIVSSVTTRDGFRRTGEAQKVLSKYTAAGVPLYRTIINKFAVLNIFIMTDRLSRAKISSIILGPTDAVKLQPKTNELKNIEASIKQDLFTSNVADITGIQTAQPITITAPPIQPAETIITPTPEATIKPTIKQRDYFVEFASFFDKVFYIDNGRLIASPQFSSILTDQERPTYGNYGGQTGEAIRRLKEKGYPVDSYPHKKFHHEIDGRYVDEVAIKNFEEFFGVSVAPTPTTPTTKPASSICLLSTLYAWYTAQGQTLPLVGQRATLYEQLGLGLAAYYIGTSEQNMKLLQSLKRNSGCVV